ncbi:hypothetical protein IWZ01DRAFT_513505, partial [Phyllosticta capitalensis]
MLDEDRTGLDMDDLVDKIAGIRNALAAAELNKMFSKIASVNLPTPSVSPIHSKAATVMDEVATKLNEPRVRLDQHTSTDHLASISTGSAHSRLRAAFAGIASVSPPTARGPSTYSDATTVISRLDAELDGDRVSLDDDHSAEHMKLGASFLSIRATPPATTQQVHSDSVDATIVLDQPIN